MANFRYKSITEVSALIQQQKISPEELVNECLEHIEQLQPGLNAFITVAGESALQEATRTRREIQEGNWKGPLHGIPIGVKDFFDTAGVRTTGATAAFFSQPVETFQTLGYAAARLMRPSNFPRSTSRISRQTAQSSQTRCFERSMSCSCQL